MRQSTRQYYPILALCAVILASLACNMPAPRIGGPRAPAQAAQPSPESLTSFNDKWRELNQSAPNGPFSITFTEAELTSAVASAIAQAEAESSEPIPVEDVQVVLTDQTIYVYGRAKIDIVETNGLIVVVPTIGPDGRVHVDIASIEFGPLEVDPELLAELVATVESSINAPIQTSPFSITLATITIADGQMTIAGTIAP
jgi:hypothetical protein